MHYGAAGTRDDRQSLRPGPRARRPVSPDSAEPRLYISYDSDNNSITESRLIVRADRGARAYLPVTSAGNIVVTHFHSPSTLPASRAYLPEAGDGVPRTFLANLAKGLTDLPTAVKIQ